MVHLYVFVVGLAVREDAEAPLGDIREVEVWALVGRGGPFLHHEGGEEGGEGN